MHRRVEYYMKIASLFMILLLGACGLIPNAESEGYKFQISKNFNSQFNEHEVSIHTLSDLPLSKRKEIYITAAESYTGCKVNRDSIRWYGGTQWAMRAALDC